MTFPLVNKFKLLRFWVPLAWQEPAICCTATFTITAKKSLVPSYASNEYFTGLWEHYCFVRDNTERKLVSYTMGIDNMTIQ